MKRNKKRMIAWGAVALLMCVAGCSYREVLADGKQDMTFDNGSTIVVRHYSDVFNGKLSVSFAVTNSSPDTIEILLDESYVYINENPIAAFSDLKRNNELVERRTYLGEEMQTNRVLKPGEHVDMEYIEWYKNIRPRIRDYKTLGFSLTVTSFNAAEKQSVLFEYGKEYERDPLPIPDVTAIEPHRHVNNRCVYEE